MQFKVEGRGGQKKVVKLGGRELERIRKGEIPLRKREVLSFVMEAFGPIGYIGPVLLQEKLLIRGLYGAGSPTWDEDLLKEDKRLWGMWPREMEEDAGVTMSRCVRPEGAIGETSLAGFSSASTSTTCTVVYIVWDATPQQEARLIMRKVRVAPLHGRLAPKAELQAMVILVRIITMVLRAAAFKCNRVSLATEYACCIAALNWPGATLNPYFTNRVAEITHSLSELKQELEGNIEKLSLIEGKLNQADVGTRPGIRLSSLGPGSKWQAGPEFLKMPRDWWPLKNRVYAKVPKE
jgi:hypothetical protein